MNRSWALAALLLLLTLTWFLARPKPIPADLIAETSWGPIVATDPDGPGPFPGGLPRVAGCLVVDFQDGIAPEEIRKFGRDHGVVLKYNSEHSAASGLTVLFTAEERLAGLLQELPGDPRVEAVSPNGLVEAAGFPNDPMYPFQWHMQQIRAEQAWPWSSGQHAVVAVIDTGVAYRDYEDRFKMVEDLERTHFVPGYDFVNRRTEALDDNSHGTHVAGTVAQSTHNGKGVTGVAFGATVMPIKVLNRSGSGTFADVADGVRFAADHGAKVINMSLGGTYNDPAMEKAVRYAHQKGVVVVCSAGNSSQPRPGYPAAYPEALAVSATDYEENLAWYSNYGPDIDIAAPGGDTRYDRNGDGQPDGVLQNTIQRGNPTQSDYLWFQGTSMASPHVAGVAALVASLGVTEVTALEAVLKKTARPKGDGFGAGIVDARAAVWEAGFVHGSWKLAFGLGACLLALAGLLRRLDVVGIALLIPGVLVGACGLLYCFPALGWNHLPLNHLLTNGFPSWDLALLGASAHGNPLAFSALTPLLFGALALSSRLLRPVAAGFAAGVAGHLLFCWHFHTVALQRVPPELQTPWLVGHALLCIALSALLAAGGPRVRASQAPAA